MRRIVKTNRTAVALAEIAVMAKADVGHVVRHSLGPSRSHPQNGNGSVPVV